MPTPTVPRHIAIIMDGNGRWAQSRGKIRSAGHLAGAKNIRRVVEAAMNAGVEYMTLYAFSTENWKREKAEVSYLMNLIPRFCRTELKTILDAGVRLLVSGRMDGLPSAARKALEKDMAESANNQRFTLILAINYGGRAEIVDAVNKIVADTSRASRPVTEEDFASYLYLPNVPDPDLMIRTGGEFRISNFLLWELSYAEFYVTDTYWPDFDADSLQQALDAFGNRNRRFGNVNK